MKNEELKMFDRFKGVNSGKLTLRKSKVEIVSEPKAKTSYEVEKKFIKKGNMKVTKRGIYQLMILFMALVMVLMTFLPFLSLI